MINIEFFSCAGGMAEGFRRAGVTFDYAFDFEEHHCSSYERNLGHRPIRMDVRELLAMVRGGFRYAGGVRLLVADPPCTPWSRAGKREGQADERDMLADTCELIRLLRPQTYLIGNVPGLDDSVNWHIVQKVLAPLAKEGYCVADFAALDAADYGVPQHRVRPFWFGHLAGPCIQWPAPSHGDPADMDTLTLPGITPLIPWITCAQALGHLEGEELGRPVRLRHRSCNSDQHGSVAERPARVVGTSNLSDGNVLVEANRPGAHSARGEVTVNGANHQMSKPDAPARAISTLSVQKNHPPSYADEPSRTVRAGDGQGANRALVLDGSAPTTRKRGQSTQGAQDQRIHSADKPSPTVLTDIQRVSGNGVKLEWPWPRPSTTVQRDERLAAPGHHDENWDGGLMSTEGAVILSERAAAILQGFPDGECNGHHYDKDGKYDDLRPGAVCGECGKVRRWHFEGDSKKRRWSQIGQAMPAQLAHAVATMIVLQEKKRAISQGQDQGSDGVSASSSHGEHPRSYPRLV